MRKSIVMLFVALLAAAPLMTGQTMVTADIPFAISVYGREYPAGQWEFRVLSDPVNAVLARNLDAREAFLLASNVFQERTLERGTWPTKLVFNRYGDKYFLSEVHFGWPSYRYFAPGKQERDLLVAGLKPARTWIFAKLK
jgi:hypothetical protein